MAAPFLKTPINPADWTAVALRDRRLAWYHLK